MAPFAGTLPNRVWMLPRSSTKWRSRRAAASCARRRTDPVATVAPTGRPARVEPISASRGVASLAEGGEMQPVSRRRRQVLGGVHCHVGVAAQHGVLDLFDEHALTADGVQWHLGVLGAITQGLDEGELHDEVAVGGHQHLGDHLSLCSRLSTAAGGQTQRPGAVHHR